MKAFMDGRYVGLNLPTVVGNLALGMDFLCPVSYNRDPSGLLSLYLVKGDSLHITIY